MDYNIGNFIKAIKQSLYDNFPNMDETYPNNTGYMQTRSSKHPNTPMPVRDVALGINEITMVDDNLMAFDIGNDFAERKYPYYHILEDSPVIRKRGKGTKKSKGTETTKVLMSNRDYSIVNFNGKTFSKEYSRNVRGARRSIIDKSTRYVNGEKINTSANSYANTNYHYIERILNATLPFLAEDNGLRMGRTTDSGLAEEYIQDYYDVGITSEAQMSDYVSSILGEL